MNQSVNSIYIYERRKNVLLYCFSFLPVLRVCLSAGKQTGLSCLLVNVGECVMIQLEGLKMDNTAHFLSAVALRKRRAQTGFFNTTRKTKRQGRMIGLTAKGSVSPMQTNTPPTQLFFLHYLICMLDTHKQYGARVSTTNIFHGNPIRGQTFPLL